VTLYYTLVSSLVAIGIVGALYFSYKVAHSPLRRAGVVRRLEQAGLPGHGKLKSAPEYDVIDSNQVKLSAKAGLREASAHQSHGERFYRDMWAKRLPVHTVRSLTPTVDLEMEFISQQAREHVRTVLAGMSEKDRLLLKKLFLYEAKKPASSSQPGPPPAETAATTELQDKVKDLEKRLRKLESESLRKSQEDQQYEDQEFYIQ